MTIDPGILGAVMILNDHGIETFESCEGGEGHCFPEPTVRFHGDMAAGPKAISVCFDCGLSVSALRRYWSIERYEMVGPHWELTFRDKVPGSVGQGVRDWNNGADENSVIEAAAEKIYNTWMSKSGWVPWVPGGNSDMQDKARNAARAHKAAS